MAECEVKYSRRKFLTMSPALLMQQFIQPGTLPSPPLPSEVEQALTDARQTVQIEVLIWMFKVHEWRIREIERKFINTGWWKPRKYRPT